MKELKIYSGHIRNWKKLCSLLEVDETLPREKREEQLILRAYEKWNSQMGLYIQGIFSFAFISLLGTAIMILFVGVPNLDLVWLTN